MNLKEWEKNIPARLSECQKCHYGTTLPENLDTPERIVKYENLNTVLNLELWPWTQ